MSVRELETLAAVLDETFVEPADRLNVDSHALVLREVLFHDEHRYWQFTPAQSRHSSFPERLVAWLTNDGLSNSDAALLLRLVPELQFVDRDDMLTLYRSAFAGPIQRWLMDILNLTFAIEEHELRAKIVAGVGSTWFCPITDSFDIAQFHHANGIAGNDQRPSWRILKRFGDDAKIREYMATDGLQRIVLLEDFVGSGTQTAAPLLYAATLGVPVLFVPLIITSDGLERLAQLTTSITNVLIAPVFVLPRHVQIREAVDVGEMNLFAKLRPLIARTFPVVRQPMPPETEVLQEPYGFRGLGTLLVLHTNCPNNTLPLVWHTAPEWSALFPRVSRA
jgi:hypothetical protein